MDSLAQVVLKGNGGLWTCKNKRNLFGRGNAVCTMMVSNLDVLHYFGEAHRIARSLRISVQRAFSKLTGQVQIATAAANCLITRGLRVYGYGPLDKVDDPGDSEALRP